jgi:hypothetical protein
MSKIILIILLCFTNLAQSANQATAQVGTRVISVGTTEIRKKLITPEGNIELISEYGDKDCSKKYHIKLSKNNIVNQSKQFGTCSDIVRAKLFGSKLIISMPNKNDKNFTTYIYDTEKLTLSNQ